MRREVAWLFASFGAVSCLVVVSSFVVSAQVIDASACQESCREQKTQCVTECGAHPNPVECEAECDSRLYDCLRECR